jgi:hypothetical protein
MPKPGLLFRVQLTDRRPASSWELLGDSFVSETKPPALTAVSGGIYHHSTESRFLYGVSEIYGLAARIRNPWIRGAPYAEAHAPSSADLKTKPSSTGRPLSYFYLGTPSIPLGTENGTALRGFTALALQETGSPALTAGADLAFDRNPRGGGDNSAASGGSPASGSRRAKGLIRLEGFYTELTLPPRSSSTWFSMSPALPERDFRLLGGSLLFNTPFAAFAADGAYSETFAYGRDFYGNLGVRLGDRPWRLSLAVDGAGSRYVGSDGASPGAGFRTAAKVEKRGRRSSLLRFSALFRGSGEEGEHFNRGELGFYYRPPAPSSPFGLTRVFADLKRDSRDPAEVLDSAGAGLGLKFGPLGSVSEAKLSGSWNAGTSPDLSLQIPETYRFESLRLQETLNWTLRVPGVSQKLGNIHCKAGAGYTLAEGKEAVWDGSLSAYIQGRWFSGTKKTSRFSVKIASEDFPEKWAYTLSWRVQY